MFTGVVLKAITFIPSKAYAQPVIRYIYISFKFLFNKANLTYFNIIAVKRNKLAKLADKFQALNKTLRGY